MIVFDPGHGGIDSGARISGVDHFCEKDWVLKCCLEVKRLAKPGSVALTREDDRFLELTDRAAIANSLGAQYFISVHNNAYWPRPNAGGFEIFKTSSRGQALAEKLVPGILNILPSEWPNRGIKNAEYTVLTNTAMPAVLAEFGFVSNDRDMEWLKDPESPTVAANAMVQALGIASSNSVIPTPADKRCRELEEKLSDAYSRVNNATWQLNQLTP